ncbi:MAG: GNAT family N-acetyltransferase [Candidatus Edwardsbacteria bacterium]|nr:GNAT family N-acetyltransferase [Candidatus Edwardsbacteria bacterium]MBU1575620.1 GNAT family N-acetyltransferase [Candidatus Edwardsbacteria bacterium]MBU2593876.1 GNAT family N-acetyltransferase [Candidatus Edwardsbacteria bacterium]
MTLTDIDPVVQTHLLSFPKFFLSILGPRFLSLYYSSVCSDSSGIALVGLNQAGRVTGFVAGTTNPRGFYTRLLKKRWLKFAMASFSAVLQKPSIIPRMLGALSFPKENPVGQDVAGLYSIGISPDDQQQGMGRQLVAEFLIEARIRGCRQVFLTTDRDDNDGVNGFYQKNKFTIKRQFVTPQGRRMNEYWIDL